MFITDILKLKEISMTQKLSLIMKLMKYIFNFHERPISLEDFDDDDKMIIDIDENDDENTKMIIDDDDDLKNWCDPFYDCKLKGV